MAKSYNTIRKWGDKIGRNGSEMDPKLWNRKLDICCPRTSHSN